MKKQIKNIKGIASKLDHTSASVSADKVIGADKFAKMIDTTSVKIMKSLNRDVANLQTAFDQAKKDLEGLRKAGAGDTEANTLLKEIVVPKAEKLKKLAEHIYFLVDY